MGQKQSKGKPEMALEQQKSKIVNDLMAMNVRMKSYSGHLENQLEDVHKQGGVGPSTKKFGYGGADGKDHIDMMKQPMNKTDRKIN